MREIAVATSALRRAIKATAVSVAVAGGVFIGTGIASAALDPGELAQVTDDYMFNTGLNEFQTLRAQQPHGDQLDWSSDGCSHAPDNPFGFNLVKACYRHDFGYRNFKAEGRFNDANKLAIDNNFRDDMYQICDGNWACDRFADTYYYAVRAFGS
jgi:phospholipase A2-like protein